MSRALIVQPHRMLQHAFSVALFPEHQVDVMEVIPDAAAMKDVDLVIVDAAALRERHPAAAGEFRDVQGWKIPTIWIDDKKPEAQGPIREKFVLLHPPVGKESLQRAMAECLGAANAEKSAATGASPSPTMGMAETGESTATSAQENLIELVDVVEEESAPEISKAEQKKK